MLSGDFIGSTRFEVRRRIGSGAFGVVYEAFDSVRNATIAIKALRHDSADALLRFKREFRSLSDIAHRNLVQLYELIAEGDEWLVTMELIRGKSFVEYVWGQGPFRFFGTGDEPTETGIDGHGSPDGPHPTHARDSFARALDATPADLALLGPALSQLVHGVVALHASGKLHRDIKPSNVLVTTEPRVVLLDFGLVTDTDARPHVREHPHRRHARLHVAGAGRRTAAHAGQRLVQRRRDAVRGAHRRRAVSGAVSGGADAEAAAPIRLRPARSFPASRRISTRSAAICCAAIRRSAPPARRSSSASARTDIAPAVVRRPTSPGSTLPFVGRDRQLQVAARRVRSDARPARRRRSAWPGLPASARPR